MRRLVVPERELNRSRKNGDTASRAVAIDSKGGSELLELHVGRYEQGRSKPRSLDGFQEILYVVSVCRSADADREWGPRVSLPRDRGGRLY